MVANPAKSNSIPNASGTNGAPVVCIDIVPAATLVGWLGVLAGAFTFTVTRALLG